MHFDIICRVLSNHFTVAGANTVVCTMNKSQGYQSTSLQEENLLCLLHTVMSEQYAHKRCLHRCRVEIMLRGRPETRTILKFKNEI